MVRGVKKEHLPSKTCVVCGRPFTWRKKWERCWDEVTTCSKSCNQKRRSQNQTAKREQNKKKVELDQSSEKEALPDLPPGFVVQDDSLLASLLKQQAIESVAEKSEIRGALSDTSDNESATASFISPDGARVTEVANYEQEEETVLDLKAARKAFKKARKAERRAKREGRAGPGHGQKECDLCDKSVDLLVRCQVDASQRWKMVCGKCWHGVSGGVPDGDANHPHYKYGGLWKNRAKR